MHYVLAYELDIRIIVGFDEEGLLVVTVMHVIRGFYERNKKRSISL